MSLSSGFRLAHTMIRVMDTDKSLEFYCGILGMEVQRRTDYPEGKFTNTFIGKLQACTGMKTIVDSNQRL